MLRLTPLELGQGGSSNKKNICANSCAATTTHLNGMGFGTGTGLPAEAIKLYPEFETERLIKD
jgi:hypothetical protein